VQPHSLQCAIHSHSSVHHCYIHFFPAQPITIILTLTTIALSILPCVGNVGRGWGVSPTIGKCSPPFTSVLPSIPIRLPLYHSLCVPAFSGWRRIYDSAMRTTSSPAVFFDAATDIEIHSASSSASSSSSSSVSTSALPYSALSWKISAEHSKFLQKFMAIFLFPILAVFWERKNTYECQWFHTPTATENWECGPPGIWWNDSGVVISICGVSCDNKGCCCCESSHVRHVGATLHRLTTDRHGISALVRRSLRIGVRVFTDALNHTHLSATGRGLCFRFVVDATTCSQQTACASHHTTASVLNRRQCSWWSSSTTSRIIIIIIVVMMMIIIMNNLCSAM